MFHIVIFLLFLLSPAMSLGAISGATLTNGGDGTCNTGGTTASITPTANALVFACVTTEINAGTAGTVTAAGNNLTWVEVANVLSGDSLVRSTLLRALGPTPSAGTLVFTASADQVNCTWNVSEFTGINTSGTNGSGAIAQNATNTSAGTTTLVVTLAAFASTANATSGCFGVGTNDVMTVGAGFTELGTQMSCCGSRTLQEWKTANDTTVDVTTVGNSLFTGVAVELKIAASKKRVAPRHYSWLLEGLNYLAELFSAPAHADFRNQFALLGYAGLSGTTAQKEAQFMAIANQFGYEWIIGLPTGGSKANTAVLAGLKVMLSSNADRGGKWYNFKMGAGGTEAAPVNPTQVNIGTGNIPITSSLYTELELALCMTSAGASMTFPTIWNGSAWKFSVEEISSISIIFRPNYYKQASIDQNVTSNIRTKSLQEGEAGRPLYTGLYFDETNFPTNFAPACSNPGNTSSGATAWDAGRKIFIKQLRDAFNAVVVGGSLGVSGNPFRIDQFDPEQNDANITLDFLYSESSGGTDCDSLAELEAGPATGCGTQDTTTWGVVPLTKSDVQLSKSGGNPAFDASYRAGQLIAGRAASQSVWLGWFAVGPPNVGSLPASNNSTQLLRAIPNWDNMIAATSRVWTESTDIYTSSNSRIDNNIAWSRHWRDRTKLFVVRNSGSPTIALAAGQTLVTAKCVDAFFVETSTCFSGFFSQSGTTITLGGSVVNGNGYVLFIQSNPTFLSARVDVADQLDVCWNPGDSLAMLPAADSTGWTVTVDAVSKIPTSTSRQGNTCFRLVFAGSTITTGTQVVTVAYTPGNITNGSLAAATAFAAQTAVNTLPGGGALALQTQTRSQLRHFDGDEIIAAGDKYGAENGNMSSVLGGVFRVRLKVANTVAAASPMAFALFYDRNDSTWVRVTDSCATSAIVFKDAPQLVTGTLTTEQLQSSHATNIDCQIIESAGAEPTLTLPQNSETECEYAVRVCTDAALGAMRFRVQNNVGAALSSYTVTPTATIVVGHTERHGMQVTGGSW